MGAGDPGAIMPAAGKIGQTAAMQFLAGWLTEYSLSVDNLFVIALIFSYFKIPAKFQHRVLFWGIIGALVARGVMIFAGTALVSRFEWLLYLLGAFLVYTGVKMALSNEDEERDFDKMLVVKLTRKIFPLTTELEGEHFFVRHAGKIAATPLLLVLVIIETTDVIFAVDSIPAIIGITRDEFIIFTSNVFAILGLRSLFFALAALMDKFHYLKYSLSFVLAFVGVKMLLEGVQHVRTLLGKVTTIPSWLEWLPDHAIHVPTAVSLGVIVASLTLGVVASLLYAKSHPGDTSGHP
jgi:tellurite resistance protein TerC